MLFWKKVMPLRLFAFSFSKRMKLTPSKTLLHHWMKPFVGWLIPSVASTCVDIMTFVVFPFYKEDDYDTLQRRLKQNPSVRKGSLNGDAQPGGFQMQNFEILGTITHIFCDIYASFIRNVLLAWLIKTFIRSCQDFAVEFYNECLSRCSWQDLVKRNKFKFFHASCQACHPFPSFLRSWQASHNPLQSD